MTSESSNEPKKVPLRIRLPFATEEEFVGKYGAHVTRGGIFIPTKASKPEGTPLSLELVLQDGTRLMRGEGVVQKVLVDEQPGRSGMLVRFTRIDARTKGLIDLILERREGLTNAEPPPAPPPAAAQPPPAKPPAPPPPAPAPAPARKGPVPFADDVVLGIDLGTTTCRA
ncbi:MAG: TIGR02266 family protein, partial [Myxococcota bacterium]